jgi:transposase
MPHWKSIESPRKRGRPLTYEEKWMVYYAFQSFERHKADSSVIVVEDPYAVTSSYIGVSRTTVAKIVKSVRESGRVPQFKSPGNRNQTTAIPLSTEARIREFVFERHREGAICNSKHIVALLKEECNLDIQDRTMRRHLARMGFCWSRTKKQPRSLRESSRVRQQRHDYLYEIRKNRSLPAEAQYHLVYLDESFLHHHYGAQFSWFSDGDFVERSVGKGRRWCFIHALMEEGLLNGALLIFEAKKSTGEYHQQFNQHVFQKWFQDQLLSHFPKRCLIVMDRCPFHMVGKDSITPQQMRKVELQDWLTQNGFPWEENWLKPRLIEEVEAKRDKTTMVEMFAEHHGHRVLWLPVHHPELSPIELVWNTVKGECARLFSNQTSFQDQRIRLEDALTNKIDSAYCSEAFNHVRLFEEKYWKVDLELDDELDDENEFYGTKFDYIL